MRSQNAAETKLAADCVPRNGRPRTKERAATLHHGTFAPDKFGLQHQSKVSTRKLGDLEMSVGRRAAPDLQSWPGFVDHAAYLRQGRWAPVHAHAEVWRHVGSRLPDSLRREVTSWVARNTQGRGKLTRFIRTRLTRTFFWWRSRRRVTVPAVGCRVGNASVVRRTGDYRADVIALGDPRGVFRLGQANSYDCDYAEVRTRYARHFPTPDFSVSDDGSVLLESFVYGRQLQYRDSERCVTIALDLLERYAALASSEHVSAEGTLWPELPRLLREVTVPEQLQGLLIDERASVLLNSEFLVPSQGGGIMSRDIFVDQRTGRYQVLDFDKAAWCPVWFDPVMIASNTPTGGDERTQLAISAALNRIWRAVGLVEAEGLSLRQLTALLAVGRAFRHAGRTKHVTIAGAFTSPNRDDFAHHLQNISTAWRLP